MVCIYIFKGGCGTSSLKRYPVTDKRQRIWKTWNHYRFDAVSCKGSVLNAGNRGERYDMRSQALWQIVISDSVRTWCTGGDRLLRFYISPIDVWFSITKYCLHVWPSQLCIEEGGAHCNISWPLTVCESWCEPPKKSPLFTNVACVIDQSKVGAKQCETVHWSTYCTRVRPS